MECNKVFYRCSLLKKNCGAMFRNGSLTHPTHGWIDGHAWNFKTYVHPEHRGGITTDQARRWCTQVPMSKYGGDLWNFKGKSNFQLFPRSILVAREVAMVLVWWEKIRQCTTFRVMVLTSVVSTLRSRVSIPAILYEMYQWHLADGWLHMWSQVSWWLLSKDAWEGI